MKNKFLLLALTSCISSSASAATVFAFDYQSQPIGVWYQEEHVNTTNITPNGGLVMPGIAIANYGTTGWDVSPAINVNSAKSVTFDVSVEEGYQMTLTSFHFMANRVGAGATRLNVGGYGYRVDNGNGFGDWTVYNFTLGAAGSAYDWTFDAPVVVTDTIQFGFWAAGATEAGGTASPTGFGRSGDDMFAQGTVSAIPEPSSLLLGTVGSLAVLRRRRA